MTNLTQKIILRRIIQILIIGGIMVMAITPVNHENDIFWQLRMGEEIVVKHHFPIRDPYSLPAAGEVWTLHEWIPAVVFYLVNARFGPAGLILFKAATMAATFGLFLRLFNKLKANLYLSLILFALAALVNTRGIWVVFPSMFEYLFLVVSLYLLELYKQKGYRAIPIALMLLSLLWANSHASFFLLPIVISCYLFGDILVGILVERWSWYKPGGEVFDQGQKKILMLVIVVALVAPVATPNGLASYYYPFKIAFGPFTKLISEYQGFWMVWQQDRSYFVHTFTFALMVTLVFVLLVRGKNLHPTDLLLGIFFTILPLTAVRHIAIFSLVALFLIVRSLSPWFGEYRGLFARNLRKDLLVILFTGCFLYYYKTKLSPFGLYLSEDGYPKVPAELVNSSGIPGNMFNHYNSGGYLIWKMPKYKVFIDGRLEMYEGQAGKDYITILTARPGYNQLLEKYNINFVLIDINTAIVEALVGNPMWKYIYSDKDYVLLVKDGPNNSAFLARNWTEEKEKSFLDAYQASLAIYKAEQFTKDGLAAIRANDLSNAIVNFEAAAKFSPGSIQAHLNLAQAYMVADLPQKAKAEYEFILVNLDANNQDAKKGLSK